MLEILSRDGRARTPGAPDFALGALPTSAVARLRGEGMARTRGIAVATQRPARAAMAILVCGLALLFAREMLMVWGIPDADLLDPFADANTYLAAGERLNEGHALYQLGPDDRPVLLMGGSPVPLFSPPPIAAIWRPLAAVPLGFPIWVAAAWVALLGTVAYLVMKIGLRAAVVAAALSFPIGEQLVAANLTAFFPGLLVLTWHYRHDPRAGVLIGVMAALKLTPAVMGGWFVGAQRWKGIAWMVAGGLILAGLGVLGAGVVNSIGYAGVLGTIPASQMSLSSLSGLAWLSPLVLVSGTIIAAMLWRWPRLAFVVGVVTLVAGSPALYLTTFTLFLAALAPLIPERDRAADQPSPITSRRSGATA